MKVDLPDWNLDKLIDAQRRPRIVYFDARYHSIERGEDIFFIHFTDGSRSTRRLARWGYGDTEIMVEPVEVVSFWLRKP